MAQKQSISRSAGGGGKKSAKVINQQELITDIETVSIPVCIKDNNDKLEAWKLYLPVLIAHKIFKGQHINHLILLCEAWATIRKNQRMLEIEGEISPTKEGGLKPSPRIAILQKAKDDFIRLGSLLMLDPTSELRLSPTTDTEENNPFLDLS